VNILYIWLHLVVERFDIGWSCVPYFLNSIILLIIM